MENLNLSEISTDIIPYVLITFSVIIMILFINLMWEDKTLSREHNKIYKGIKTTRRKTPTTTRTVVILSTNERYKDAQKRHSELNN